LVSRRVEAWHLRGLVLAICLTGLGLILLLPKLALGLHASQVLSIPLGGTRWTWMFVQDAALALVLLAVMVSALRRGVRGAFLGGALLVLVFALLFIDARARQLWLQPIDLKLITYFFQNLHGLMDGAPVFLEGDTLWRMTFRRAVVFVLLLAGTLILLVAALSRGRALAAPTALPRSRVLLIPAAVLALSAVFAPRLPYQLERLGFVGAAVEPVRWEPAESASPEALRLAQSFDQPVLPLADQWQRPRQLLAGAKPFDSVIVVVYESVRWKSTQPPADPRNVAPTLTQLAREGAVMRAYASVPHSSKGYHAIFSGTYPSPGVEILEAQDPPLRTIWSDLKASRSGLTMAVSSVPLTFENMSGQLRVHGFDHVFTTSDLTSRRERSSSFGTSDEGLYSAAVARMLAMRQGAQPYALALFPMAAHYPYNCPGSMKDRSEYADYLACVSHSEALLAELVARMKADPAFDQTLLVVVGDHGESFGERGLFIHNSSLYEEEMTVPLAFWSRDGRLRSDAWPSTARQIDIAPTIADLLNLPRGQAQVQGQSLLRRASGDAFVNYMATFYDGLQLGLVENRAKYMLDVASGKVSRFDLDSDPLEQRPQLLDEARSQAVRDRLKAFRAHQRKYLTP
jgi:hypothetical protein